MNLLRYCYTVLCVLLFAGAAEAAGGVITGDLRFFQAQENYCPNSRNCVGSMYTQSDFNVYAPIADIKIYLEDASGNVIGQSTTNSSGQFTLSWYSPGLPAQVTLEWRSEHKDGRFAIRTPSAGALYMGWWSFTPVDGTTVLSPQNIGTGNWGTSGTPNQILNAYDGARRMWHYSLQYSNRMVTNFTGIDIRAFSNSGPLGTCSSSCAGGTTVQLDAQSDTYRMPQGRILHELGHIARVLSRDWLWVSNYNFNSQPGWTLGSDEHKVDAFEEGLATFFGDVAFYWSNAVEPHTCITAAACNTGSFNLETSRSTSCSDPDDYRRAISVDRYLWDIYDTTQDGANSESISQNYSTFFDALASYPSGYGDGQHNEPFSSPTVIDDFDGRSALDFSNNYFAFTSVNEWSALSQNCDP